MINELLLLIEKYTDTLTESPRTRPQVSLEFKINRQMQTFSFNPPINLVEEGKWLLAVTSFETTDSVFNIIDENISFPISSPSYLIPGDGEELIKKLNEFLKLRSENDIELHVKEFGKRGTHIEIENRGFNLAAFDHLKSQILAVLKGVEYRDLEDMVYRMELTYDEVLNVLDVKYIAGSTNGYTLKPGIYEVTDINFMLKHLLPKEVKVIITIVDIRLGSKLTTNITIRITEKLFLLYNFRLY